MVTIRIRKDNDNKSQDIAEISRIADALAHPVRISILKYVISKKNVRNDVCNCDLVKILDYSQSTISQHVKKLVNVGLFTIEKKDKFTVYSINNCVLNNYIDLLKNM